MHNSSIRHISNLKQQYLKGHDRRIWVATLHQPRPGLGPPLGPNLVSCSNLLLKFAHQIVARICWAPKVPATQQCRSWKRHFYRIVGWCSIFGVFSSRLTRSCCCPTLPLPPRSYVLSRICFAISRCCPTLPFLSRSYVLTRVWFAMSFFARSSLRLSHCFG